MLLREMQVLLEKAEIRTEAQLSAIHPIYCLLGFEKEIFCKMVDATGIEVWLNEESRWEWLSEAETYYIKKCQTDSAENKLKNLNERRKDALENLNALDEDIRELEEMIDSYKS